MPFEHASIDHLFYPPLGEKTSRAGIIPYAILDGPEEYWLLGTLPSGRLSDFGGGCFIPIGEIPYECMIKEVDKESNSLLTRTIQKVLGNAFEQGIEHGQEVDYVRVWRWVNRNRPEDISYLCFVKVDYEQLADISRDFTENEENTSLEWYSLRELIDNYTVKDFNTSIQKFIRHLGFRSN